VTETGAGTPQTFRGNAIASSDGIVIGRIQKLASGRQPIPERRLKESEVQSELQRLEKAVDDATRELREEQEHLRNIASQEPLMILKAHNMMMHDPELIEKARYIIRDKKINAEWALRQQLDAIEAVFDTIEDPYLREKKSDVEQAGKRILRHLMGQSMKFDISDTHEPQILIGKEFTPQEIVTLWRIGIAGVIAEQGGMNSHSIIVARGIGLPALIGSDNILDIANDEDSIILDASMGKWIINPTESDHEYYHKFIKALEVIRNDLSVYAGKPSQSIDAHPLPIMANLEFEEEVIQARQVGADGVGLFRTEFAFLQSPEMPAKKELHRHYAAVVRGMEGKQVVFRLLDIGGDKPALFRQLSGYRYVGENPAMGLRGIRLLLHHRDLLKVQLDALIKCADLGPVKILVPMVSMVEEMEQVHDLILDRKKALGITSEIPVGIMIEVPAAVMIARELAKVSDFFSIGTNDLIQYTLAADRGDEDVGKIYTPSHPAIRQLIQMSVDAAHDRGIPISVCGELAADPAWTQTFLNMGMDHISMSLHSILMIRKHLSRLQYHPSDPVI